MFSVTFVGQSNVLSLIKVFIVTDLSIYGFFTMCLCLPKFMQFDIYIYICVRVCACVCACVCVCVCNI